MDLSLVTDMLLAVEKDILNSVFAEYGVIISNMFDFALVANQSQAITKVCTATMMIGAALCSLVVAKQVIGTYGFGTMGDPDQDAGEIIYRLCLALGFMGANSFIFTEAKRLVTAISQDLIFSFSGVSGNVFDVPFIVQIFAGIATPAQGIIYGFMGVALLLFGFSAVMRGAEITLSKILLPIFAIDLINSNHEKWNMFFFQYLVSFGSYIVQQLCFHIFLNLLGGNTVWTNPFEYAVMLGWLILAIRTPKWLEKYIYATGTAQAICNGASRIGQVVMFATMRR